jgi:hypothetical protein
MQVIDVEAVSASIRINGMDKNENRESLHRHELHQLIKGYRKEYGAQAVEALMDELAAYHKAKVVGLR